MMIFFKFLHSKLDKILNQQKLILEYNKYLTITQRTIMINLDKLQADLQAETDATIAAVALISALVEEVKAANASGDQAAVDAIADKFAAQAKALADAVAANTPAAPVPVDAASDTPAA